MSSLINKIKAKATGKPSSPPKDSSPKSGSGEQSFTIQPHPATSNDPRDLEPPQLGGGLNSNPEQGAFHARDPHVPAPQVVSSLPPAASREEMRARAAELNSE